MKKIVAMVLCLVLTFSFVGCGDNGQESNANNAGYEDGYSAGYKEGYNVGHEDGYSEGKNQIEPQGARYAKFSGSFTATVEKLLPDYFALPGKTLAVVHFFQDGPFLLHFREDMSEKLVEGTPYVFEFKTFEVAIPDGEEHPDISDYMYSIVITDYRIAEENELGLASKMATVEIVTK